MRHCVMMHANLPSVREGWIILMLLQVTILLTLKEFGERRQKIGSSASNRVSHPRKRAITRTLELHVI